MTAPRPADHVEVKVQSALRRHAPFPHEAALGLRSPRDCSLGPLDLAISTTFGMPEVPEVPRGRAERRAHGDRSAREASVRR